MGPGGEVGPISPRATILTVAKRLSQPLPPSPLPVPPTPRFFVGPPPSARHEAEGRQSNIAIPLRWHRPAPPDLGEERRRKSTFRKLCALASVASS